LIHKGRLKGYLWLILKARHERPATFHVGLPSIRLNVGVKVLCKGEGLRPGDRQDHFIKTLCNSASFGAM
jgi:hypothetical protein